MNHTIILLLGFSILIPAVAGIVRFYTAGKLYLPFFICIWAALLNELMNYIIIYEFHGSNSVNSNIYCLTECLLYIWLFKNFNIFQHRYDAVLLGCLCTIIWCTNVLFISSITQFNSYFIITYSLLIVFMSIRALNNLVLSLAKLFQNPIFLICVGLIIYYSVSALIEIFWLYGLGASKSFRLNIYRIMAYINFSVNIIFATAILWMHRKQEFIAQ